MWENGSEVCLDCNIVVDIRHGRDKFLCEGCRGARKGDAVLACASSVYMHRFCGVSIFKLPYRLWCMYVLLIYPFVIGIGVSLPFDKVLLLVSSAELPRV